MILKGGYHKSIFLLIILLILISSQCLALSNNGQADYILIINSYTDPRLGAVFLRLRSMNVW